MAAKPRPNAQESVAVGHLHARLQQLSAEYQADRSTNKSHIYWSRPTQRWLRVTRPNQTTCVVEYWVECPCAFLEVLEAG